MNLKQIIPILIILILSNNTCKVYSQSSDFFDNKIEKLDKNRMKLFLNEDFSITVRNCAKFYAIVEFENKIYQFKDSIKSFYSSNDKPFLTGKYKNGKLNGKFTSFYENGKIKMSFEYKDGVRNGLWHTYNSEGKIIKKIFYRNGAEFLIDFYDEQGNLSVKGGVGKYEEELNMSKRSNYKTKLSGNVKNGLPDGEWVFYLDNVIIGKEYFKDFVFEKGISISVVLGESEYRDYFKTTYTEAVPIEHLKLIAGFDCENKREIGLGTNFYNKLNKKFYKLGLDKKIKDGWFLIDISTGKNRKINDVKILSNSDDETINLIKRMIFELKNPLSGDRTAYMDHYNSNFMFFPLVIKNSKPYNIFSNGEIELLKFGIN